MPAAWMMGEGGHDNMCQSDSNHCLAFRNQTSLLTMRVFGGVLNLRIDIPLLQFLITGLVSS